MLNLPHDLVTTPADPSRVLHQPTDHAYLSVALIFTTSELGTIAHNVLSGKIATYPDPILYEQIADLQTILLCIARAVAPQLLPQPSEADNGKT